LLAGSTRSVRVYPKWLGSAVLIALLLGSSYAHAADDHPLRPTDTSSPRATLQDFVEITAADIPDREAMARQPSKRWRLPNTEIDIVLIENGQRAGEYLVSAETIDRLPEFYDRVKAYRS
jgi:hypothetical protein